VDGVEVRGLGWGGMASVFLEGVAEDGAVVCRCQWE